jgi:hypothetical protein
LLLTNTTVFSVNAATTAVQTAPAAEQDVAWWKHGTVYFVLTDRFVNGDKAMMRRTDGRKTVRRCVILWVATLPVSRRKSVTVISMRSASVLYGYATGGADTRLHR